MLGFCQEHDRDDTFNMSDVSETARPLDAHLQGQNQTSHKASFFARKLKQMPREDHHTLFSRQQSPSLEVYHFGDGMRPCFFSGKAAKGERFACGAAD